MFDFLFGWRKASNCKKLIRRVQCRLKLLKNKRCSIVRQSRDDVAQLLKYGHEQSAFDRVEQIFKDESIVAVYDLLDHFCEFIVIHLSYIRKHKDCPNDINEAVSSLIFASARCGDLPELLVIRKLFGERYGQRFALVALELLPGNLVNRQIQENLSIKSVPNDVKYKLVDEIARRCLDPGPLALEYYSDLQLEQMNKSKGDQVLGSDAKINCYNSEEHQVHDFSIMEGEGKIMHVDFTSDRRNLFIESCHSHQGSNATGGSTSPFSLPWSVNQKDDQWRVGNYAHLKSPYESKILPPSVDKEVGMAVESSSDSSYQLPKEMICLDDVEEFISTTSKDGNGQDQRLFLFKSYVNIESDMVEDVLDESNVDKSEKWISDKASSRSSRKSRKVSGKRHRMRSVSKEGIYAKDIESTIYYGGSLDDSRNDNPRSHHRRKHHKRTPLDETRKSFGAQSRLGQPCHHLKNGKDGTVHECSLEDPCYFCTSDNKDECGSESRMITTLEEFPAHNLNEGKVGNNICCPNCRFWNGESNNQEVKWALVLHKPSRDYRIGVIVPNETTKKVAKSDGFGHPPYLRAMTMPVERPSDHRVDNMLRLNSFPFAQASHVHPKLPDYDQLAAKFTALKKANLECKSKQVTLAA